MLACRLKRDAYPLRFWDAQPIGQARGVVALVNHHRDLHAVCRKNNRDAHIAALGKKNIRAQLFEDFFGLGIPLQDFEDVRKVFPAEIPAQLAGRNAVKGKLGFLNDLFFDALFRAYVGNFKAMLF